MKSAIFTAMGLAVFGTCAASSETADIPFVSSADFAEQVVAASLTKTIVVEFYAEWCAYCLELEPMLLDAALIAGESVEVVRVDTDLNSDLVSRFGIMGLPTLIFFEGEMALTRLEGVPERDWLFELFTSYATQPKQAITPQEKAGEEESNE